MKYKIEYENKIKKMLKEKNKAYKYYIDTMGCALNENDTLKYRGLLEKMGISKAEKIEDANVVVFNTCCIRENAEDRLYGRLGSLKNRKKKEKDFYICIVGCMTEQEQVVEKIKKTYSFVDLLLGTRGMQLFSKKLFSILYTNSKEQTQTKEPFEILENLPILYEEGYRATIAIIYGCNNFCSYCVVPYVRGREKSRVPKDILKEIQKLANKGVKEILLLGQNVNSYGNDFTDKLKGYNFVKLLVEIEHIEAIQRIRFLSPHPKDFTEELIQHIAKSKKISKQIHLPLQSGSTRILKLMNRKYTKKEYLELVGLMKKTIDKISFSTDIIVGFPGETEEDFQETINVIKSVKYDQIYMFCFSKRRGTVAEKMKGQVSEKVKVERLRIIKKMFEEMVYAANEKLLGKTIEVVVEGKSKSDLSKYSGRTEENKIVVFESKDEDIGMVKKVRITSNNLWYLKGKIVK